MGAASSSCSTGSGRGRLDPVLRLTHQPGDKLFVDWAGAKIPIRDPQTGTTESASIFVAALGMSHKIYAEAFQDQRIGSWITAHVHALEFYGGVPRLIIPDNPRTAVATHCRYEPKLHQSYGELAKHYGTAILPARPRKPRDKASVETAVQIVQREILGALRDHTFFSLSALNEQIRRLLPVIKRPALHPEGGMPGGALPNAGAAGAGSLARSPLPVGLLAQGSRQNCIAPVRKGMTCKPSRSWCLPGSGGNHPRSPEVPGMSGLSPSPRNPG